MMKRFRNIRKKLFQERKTANYFKYTVGKIVLVVIGVLCPNTNPKSKTQRFPSWEGIKGWVNS